MAFRIPTLRCRRCGHTWVPRIAVVQLCARCKSPYRQTARTKPTRRKERR